MRGGVSTPTMPGHKMSVTVCVSIGCVLCAGQILGNLIITFNKRASTAGSGTLS